MPAHRPSRRVAGKRSLWSRCSNRRNRRIAEGTARRPPKCSIVFAKRSSFAWPALYIARGQGAIPCRALEGRCNSSSHYPPALRQVGQETLADHPGPNPCSGNPMAGITARALGGVPNSLPSPGLLRTSCASSLLGYMALAMRPRRSSRPRFFAAPSSLLRRRAPDGDGAAAHVCRSVTSCGTMPGEATGQGRRRRCRAGCYGQTFCSVAEGVSDRGRKRIHRIPDHLCTRACHDKVTCVDRARINTVGHRELAAWSGLREGIRRCRNRVQSHPAGRAYNLGRDCVGPREAWAAVTGTGSAVAANHAAVAGRSPCS